MNMISILHTHSVLDVTRIIIRLTKKRIDASEKLIPCSRLLREETLPYIYIYISWLDKQTLL